MSLVSYSQVALSGGATESAANDFVTTTVEKLKCQLRRMRVQLRKAEFDTALDERHRQALLESLHAHASILEARLFRLTGAWEH